MRRMAQSVVVAHVVARLVDFYITKYAAKPMEQLQNLVTQYALGIRRLEVQEEQHPQAAVGAQEGAWFYGFTVAYTRQSQGRRMPVLHEGVQKDYDGGR